ncbi:acetylxylan esterase [Ancylobacter lacus]|uniref:acetylxylan esterase n=1 Tax=Ancylobacter lacus TaxID=2579970 RepID=UPI001BCFB926|nr:acetylxylan esterase [Ancylobacter lacus]MBS7541293.1 acetylxylan esterase [Ancylobacter lacus]
MSVPTQHCFGFDPTYGMTLDALRAVQPPEAPPDFDAFWKGRHTRARAVDPHPVMSRSRLDHPDWHVFDISYRSTGGFTIRGWMLLPRAGEVQRGLVVGHGYGGRTAPDFDLPVENTALLFPCFRGLSLSAAPPISSDPAWHVLHDIDKPDAYIIGGCVEDLWIAVSTLLVLYPWLDGRIGYSGISFGGGIGAFGCAFDPRIRRGHLALPTFGDQPLRLRLPSTGSARAVQNYEARHGRVMETLRLYDAAVAATRFEVPMLIAVALFDPAVAPPCQFAIANASPKFNETVILDAGHVDYPGSAAQHEALRATVRRFFGQL